ncbi:hypothetical protein BDR26DRAFT_937101 [Obelidium mucronatum]|nr:hypothetical protein BDR26DRAFT_937101 [Obelidium mucronatum]
MFPSSLNVLAVALSTLSLQATAYFQATDIVYNTTFTIYATTTTATANSETFSKTKAVSSSTTSTTGSSKNPNATICITATGIPPNTYIGFGIPSAADWPYMMGSDITCVFGNSSGVGFIHGRGMASDHPYFSSDSNIPSDSGIETYEDLVESKSSYNVGSRTLKACFERPMYINERWGSNLTMGVYTYLWAVGSMEQGNVGFHVENRGVVYNGTLFGKP